MSQENEFRYSYAPQQQENPPPSSANLRPNQHPDIARNNDRNSFIWSTISDIQAEMTPQLLRVKNNILLFLLGLSAYGLYYVVGEFINYIIIGYITGLAYSQTRSKFTALIRDRKSYQKINEKFSLRLLKIIALLLFVFALPRLRYMLIHPNEFRYIFDYRRYLISFRESKNVTVIICQTLICLYCLFLLLLPKLKMIGQKIRPTKDSHVHCMFGIFVFIFTMTFVIMIPAVIFKEVGQVGFVIQQKIQQNLQCQLLNFGSHNVTLPLCSERIVQNNFIRQMMEEFRNQNQTIKSCKQYIQKLQLDYIGHNVFNYDEIACTWYSILIKASNYTNIQENNYDLSTASLFSTGTNIFKTLFGNLASILIAMSNYLFCFTIWLTTFTLTTKLPNKYLTIKQVFSEKKQELVGGVTKLITSTCMIVFWHFIASVILLQLFALTPINLIISIFLSLMAFIPYFRPWFGVFFVAIVKAIFLKDYVQYLITIIFVGLYYSISEQIYTFYYSKFEIHSIITNLSVLLGIYRFGISGIFYGPLIIIVYTCVEKQLLSNYKYKFTTTHNKASVILPQNNPPPQKKQSKKSKHDPKKELQHNIQMLKRLSGEHKDLNDE